MMHPKDAFKKEEEKKKPQGMPLPVCLMPRLQSCGQWSEDLHS
jgi:hypothetical protein